MANWIELYTPGDSALLVLARSYKEAAAGSATSAGQSATAAGQSATAAGQSATAAGQSATAAGQSAAVAGAAVATALVTLADGAANAPALAFGAEPQTGIYRIGALALGFALGGVVGGSFTASAGAVNYIDLRAGATGTPGRVQVAAVGTDANVSLVLSAKGTGALIGALPDSTSQGGNARGSNAVDWQQVRASAAQVASGVNATIGGGLNNTASGSSAAVAGGEGNTASNIRATVAGGNSNTASAINAAVGGGSNNVASGTSATVGGGSTNTAGGINSWVPGGAQATTRGIAGRGAWSGGRISSNGDAQCGEHHLSRQTTDATATRLTADGALAGTTNTINLPNFGSYAGMLTVVAKATGSTAAATWRIPVSAVRGSGAATVVVYEGAGTAIAPTASNGTGSAWRLDIAADITNGGIAVTVTGAAATTINHSARFANVEATTVS